jgi:hypothetical protein
MMGYETPTSQNNGYENETTTSYRMNNENA